MNKKLINEYFREFVINHKDVVSFDEHCSKWIREIEQNNSTVFHNNWNYIMVLVQIIERLYSVCKIITSDNYVGFEMQDVTIQDKGPTKLDAYYIVCFKTLQRYWIEGQTTERYKNCEPFDEHDLI